MHGPLLRCLQELLVQVTDEGDPCFYLSVVITEDDFQTLKSQQGLLVDFHAFPQKFIDLLNLCRQEQEQPNPKSVDTRHRLVSQKREYILNLVSGSSSAAITLEVVETNPFKHLCHLALILVPGNDAQVKSYLADCVKLLKMERDSLSRRLSQSETSLRDELAHARSQSASRGEELQRLRQELASSRADLMERHAQQHRRLALFSYVQPASYTNYKMRAEMTTRYEEDRREWEAKLSRLSHQMESRVAGLDAQNRDLAEKKHTAEASIRELLSRLSTLESSLKSAEKELQEARSARGSSDATRKEMEKEIVELRAKLMGLELSEKEKTNLTRRQADHLHTAQETRRRLEEQLQEKQSTLVRRENSIKQMTEELTKANQIIHKLQGEVRSFHTKVSAKQEAVIREKEEAIERLKRDLEEVRGQVALRGGEKVRLEEEVAQMKTRLEDLQKTIRTNENVIAYLNKQLNEGGGGGGAYSYLSSTVPTPSAGMSGPQVHSTPLERAATSRTVGNVRFAESSIQPGKENSSLAAYLKPDTSSGKPRSGIHRASDNPVTSSSFAAGKRGRAQQAYLKALKANATST
ncbi:unnamed protein product [Cyprideis torosa]|uniref:Spindle assembly abnormal protein 6 homolog n=1 Tax=Cyprideis torosa TaxID=163714 RepID=A0A7R8WBJ7_9CRUS|nr:unnamed protein product [Cyprideis torosa]CAG0886382.1 unnamed protein product [Cyprideis torosa]